MQKQELIVSGLFITVLTVISGVMFDQINYVRGELGETQKLVYQIPTLKEDISEIKADIKEVKQDIKTLLRESRP